MNTNKILFRRCELELNSREYVNYCYGLTKKLSEVLHASNIFFIGYKEQFKIGSINDSVYQNIINCILDDELRYDESQDGSIISNSGFISSWRIKASEKSFLDIRYTLGAGKKSNLGNSIFIELEDSDGSLESRIYEIWSEIIKHFKPEKARITNSEIDKELNPDLSVDFNLGLVNYFSGSLDLESFHGPVEKNTEKFLEGTEFFLQNDTNSSDLKELMSLQEYMISKGYISDDDGF